MPQHVPFMQVSFFTVFTVYFACLRLITFAIIDANLIVCEIRTESAFMFSLTTSYSHCSALLLLKKYTNVLQTADLSC